jgi:N-methylhydantoinase A
VVTPLNETEVRRLALEIAAIPEVEAIAVGFLFSDLNPAHELRVRDILAEELPDKSLSISDIVLPKWKEYERASTAIADASSRMSATFSLPSKTPKPHHMRPPPATSIFYCSHSKAGVSAR